MRKIFKTDFEDRGDVCPPLPKLVYHGNKNGCKKLEAFIYNLQLMVRLTNLLRSISELIVLHPTMRSELSSV